MVLYWGNMTGCSMCLDSDIFDLWRSCGDCNITEPACELTCEYCTAGEGIDTAALPAPRADQQLAIPAEGCSIDRRDYELECRPQSTGTCSQVVHPSQSGIGCQPCYSSDFVNSCENCSLEGCQLSCESCLAIGTPANRTGGPRTSLTLPPGGCEVTAFNASMICIPGSEGSCPLAPRPSSLHPAGWEIGVAAVGGLLGVLLMATLAILFWRRQYRAKRLKRFAATMVKGDAAATDPEFHLGLAETTEGYAFKSVGVPDATVILPNPFLAYLEAPHAVTISTQNPVQGQDALVPEPLQAGRVTRPAILNLDDIQVCKRVTGEDWLLGRGSYGEVYKAKMGGLDVAVKTINRQYVNSNLKPEEALQVIGKELSILRILPANRRIIDFYGSCVEDGNILLVLEFMQGGDLWNALHGIAAASPVLKWQNAGAHIALDIINGLHFLHSHNIYHRDVKSNNVLLSEDYQSAKICDVGLARIMGGTSLSSSSHVVHATFAYAAPEILLNKRSDHRVDIYSYGVVVWELIAQEHPQRGMMRDLQVPQECSQAVSDMVAACLNQEPGNRPTAQHIIRIIESDIAGNAV